MKKKRNEAYTRIDKMASAIFKNKTTLIDYLTVQANFNRYSVKNALLVASQNAGVTKLKSYNDWKEDGFQVLRNSTGITVLEPGNEFTRADGSTGRYINIRVLFDVSQVTGPFQTHKPDQSNREKMSALIHHMSPLIKTVSGERNDLLFGRAAFYSNDGIIYVNRALPFDIIYQHLTVEIAHARCAARFKGEYDRTIYGAICEMTGYIICRQNNVPISNEGIPLRIPDEYKNYNKENVFQLLQTVKDTANDISQNIYNYHKENSKEKSSEAPSKG